LSTALQAVPNFIEIVSPRAIAYIPQAWQENGFAVWTLYEAGMSYEMAVAQVGGDYINLNNAAHLSRVINRFNAEDWAYVFSRIPESYMPSIQGLYNTKNEIEVFFGLPLLADSGLRWPGVIIPVLAVITTLLQSYLSQLANTAPKDDKAKTQQKIMMFIMPVFMGFLTISFPAGVGLYWITQNVYRLVQQIIMNKQAGVKFIVPFLKPREI